MKIISENRKETLHNSSTSIEIIKLLEYWDFSQLFSCIKKETKRKEEKRITSYKAVTRTLRFSSASLLPVGVGGLGSVGDVPNRPNRGILKGKRLGGDNLSLWTMGI